MWPATKCLHFKEVLLLLHPRIYIHPKLFSHTDTLKWIIQHFCQICPLRESPNHISRCIHFNRQCHYQSPSLKTHNQKNPKRSGGQVVTCTFTLYHSIIRLAIIWLDNSCDCDSCYQHPKEVWELLRNYFFDNSLTMGSERAETRPNIWSAVWEGDQLSFCLD